MQRLTTSFQKIERLGVLAGLAVLVSCGGRGANGHLDETEDGEPDPAETPQAPPDNPPPDPGDPPPPTISGPPQIGGDFDCEPTNPTLKYWVTLDADGDGFGAGAAVCTGPTVPAGYVLQQLDSEVDCDDQDANIHPHVPDTWGDGVDSDCDNGDLPACENLVAGDASFRSAARSSKGCEDQPDLYISSLAPCGYRCGSAGRILGFVGNAGGTSSPGPVQLSFIDSSGREGVVVVTTEPLAPGATSALFELQLGRLRFISLSLDALDCNDDNNSAEYGSNGAALCL